MAYATPGKPSDLTLGNYLKIVSKGAVYNNLSEDSPMWDYIAKKKKGDSEGRQLKYLLRSAYGVGAVGFIPVTGGDYFSAAQASTSEGTAEYKDFSLTVDVERTLVAKAMSDFSAYGQPLAEELRCKTIALSRILSASLYQSGNGIIGEVSSASISGGRLSVVIKSDDTDPGHIGWFEYGDKLIVGATGDLEIGAGQRNVDASEGTTEHMVVYDIDRDTNTVVLEARTSAGAMVTLVANDNVVATDVIRRYNSSVDVTVAAGTDWAQVSEQWAGLDSLSEDDGRTVNGIALSGALAGTRKDAGGNPIDSGHFQALMSKLMVGVGQGRYKYNGANMAWESLDSLVESREVDRRFQNIEDGNRGVKALGYVHGKNQIVFKADEFCPKKRIYVVPEGDVLQFWGSDFEYVQPEPGKKFHLKPSSSGGYSRRTQAFMEGQGSLISVHSKAIGCIHNFI